MSSTRKSTLGSAKRVLATAASAAMIFALLPAGIVLAESPDNVCPPPDGVETFPDVSTGVHADNIECLAGYDLAQGYPDGEYKPGLDITRAQMATFVANLIEAALGVTLDEGDDAFTDDENSVHESNINKLANINVVTGRTAVTYGPSLVVNRAAMATFIANALDYIDDQDVDGSYPPASTTDHFTDDEASTHEDNINRLADQGIVEGQDSSTEYNPGNNVFRGQMATFVMESASEAEEDLDAWAANDVAPTTNQEFSVASGGDTASINTISTGTDPNTNRGARTYTFDTGAATVVDIALIPNDEVTVDANGVVTFGDNEGTAAQADDLGETSAVIETVNGADVADSDYQNNVTPSNGQVTFTVDSTTANQNVRPVVFVDADNDNALDLDADDKPTEDFGVGGSKQWVREEAAAGTPATTDAAIDLVNKDQDFFSTADGTFYYDSNDQFRVASTADGTCVPVSMATFEESLSTNDLLNTDTATGATVYSRDEAASSIFCIEDVAPGTPTNVTATAQDSDTIRVTWTAVTGADSYNIYRAQDSTTGDNCPAAGSSYALVANDTASPYDDNGLAAGTKYCYQVAAVADGDEGSKSAVSETAAATTSAAGTGARPIITDAKVTTDSGFTGQIDSGDVWTITFDQAMSSTTATGGTFVIEDSASDRYNVNCEGVGNTNDDAGVDAVCSLSSDSKTLTVTIADSDLSNDDTDATATDDNIATYPATIVSTDQDVKDAQGDVVDLANSTDKVVDSE